MYKLLVMTVLLSTAYTYASPTNLTSAEIDAITSGIFDEPKGSGSGTSSTPFVKRTPRPTPPTTTKAPEEHKACTIQGNPGTCEHYYKCNYPAEVYEAQIDIHVPDDECESYLDVCCEPANLLPDPVTAAPVKKELETKCGMYNKDGVGFRITLNSNQEEAQFGEFPWMVAIIKIEPVDEKIPEGQKKETYIEAGSLIHPQVVLTGANFVATDQKLIVRAGEWDTQTTKEIYPHQDRDVEKVEIHKDYNKKSLFYNIAVLFLSAPMELVPNVGVACLPPSNLRAEAGTRCLSAGWGKDKYGKEGTYQVILKKVQVPVVDHDTCQTQLRKTRLGRRFILHSSFMCAGGEERSTCSQDAGAPLVCPIQHEEGRYMQFGIMAWSITCSSDIAPSAYVDVANLRDWIDDKVVGRGFDPSVYTY
ncbi:phenoloxidase-activating factor 2-like [Achroia grisella]|uniref:phenoloxidase-activating factor 2-like n=1 Tax=Achroia grisella TaxID=688607 RepID=UPI0027D201F8|nr:phenoloxidase-activating factor 2-like [Achroia grisella]